MLSGLETESLAAHRNRHQRSSSAASRSSAQTLIHSPRHSTNCWGPNPLASEFHKTGMRTKGCMRSRLAVTQKTPDITVRVASSLSQPVVITEDMMMGWCVCGTDRDKEEAGSSQQRDDGNDDEGHGPALDERDDHARHKRAQVVDRVPNFLADRCLHRHLRSHQPSFLRLFCRSWADHVRVMCLETVQTSMNQF